MILLHWPNWRSIDELKSKAKSWTKLMERFLSSGKCPSFVKADTERGKRRYSPDEWVQSDEENNGSQNQSREQPEWVEIVAPNPDYNDNAPDFQFDDGGPDYDWTTETLAHPEKKGTDFPQQLNNMDVGETEDQNLVLPQADVSSMNTEQRFAFNLVMDTLFNLKTDPSHVNPLRLIVAGTAGSGKGFLIKCLVRGIRQLFNSNRAVQVLCPTGNSANLISGVTLHSFLKIPTHAQATKEMTPPQEQQIQKLKQIVTELLHY